MRLPPSANNRLTFVGATIAAIALIVFGFLLVLHTVTGAGQSPYAGILMFMVVPAILLFGMALIPIGMALERRHLRRTGTYSLPRFPVVDLNDPRDRNATAIFAVGSLFLLFFSVFISFQAYEATESVPFCGAMCHSVMAPEYTTYENSPHARVRCVDCHVGPGADWYVKSKLSGSYQVYSVLFHKYPQPIPAPIKSLRPAQETCEECHWPQQFFGGKERTLVHFLPDEKNTRWTIKLLVKIGGGNPTTGQTEGIHWHMNIGSHVEYIATDEARQQIPWVRMTDLTTGRVTEYMSTSSPLSKEELAKATPRRMDCMDCHNRPSHIFRSPAYALNIALNDRRIDASLPFIKRTGIELLSEQYPSQEAAMLGIAQGIRRFYLEKYPDVARKDADRLAAAIAEIQGIYRRNFFPYMKARWDVYPDNIGHVVFLGCHRCHDGDHQSADGKVITRDCSACHTILAQGPEGAIKYSAEPGGLEFAHPEDIGEAWQTMPCSGCHTGGAP